ncbi:MAG: hypothetical protein ABIG85_02100, partial [Chloroflexota bacterium]
KDAKGRPYARSGRGPNFHAVIAWGPGPRRGSDRLYWVDTTVPGCSYTAHAVSIAYSDDEGATWSKLYVERRTPAWVGGFPEVTVDRDPASPNYGAVYVVYNWLASRTAGPGMHVIASGDFGRTWLAAVRSRRRRGRADARRRGGSATGPGRHPTGPCSSPATRPISAAGTPAGSSRRAGRRTSAGSGSP